MINEKEMEEIILNEFPSIKNERMSNSSNNIDITIQNFADYTRDLAKSGDIIQVNNCFKIAETILNDGNYPVRKAIENIYVYSIGTFVFSIDAIITLKPVIFMHLKDLFNALFRNVLYNRALTC